jgi:hypothetical protein
MNLSAYPSAFQIFASLSFLIQMLAFILDAKLWHQLQPILLPGCWDLGSIISARTRVNACLHTKIFAAFFCQEDFSEDFCSIPLFYPTMIVLCKYRDYDIHSVALAAIGGAFR